MCFSLSPPRLWGWMPGVVVLVAFCANAWSQPPPSELPELGFEGDILDPIAERVQSLEEANRKLIERLEQSDREHDEQFQSLLQQFLEATGEVTYGPDGMPVVNGTLPYEGSDGSSARSTPVPDYTEGMFVPFDPAPGYPSSNVISFDRLPLRATFGPGFQLQTKDEQFSLQIHYESQIEGRVWDPSRENPGNNGFFLPRQRFFFNGTVTQNVEYELSINRGVNNINLLNAYLNFHFDDRFELRVGRFFTPFPYDQYAISNYWLLTPERSLFTTNLSLNRQIGAMAWGYWFDKRLDYAIGVFNGSRNSFESPNNAVDTVGYLNARPFQESDFPLVRFLNFGTSFAFGWQDQNPSPATFRIGAGSPDTNIPTTGASNSSPLRRTKTFSAITARNSQAAIPSL